MNFERTMFKSWKDNIESCRTFTNGKRNKRLQVNKRKA